MAPVNLVQQSARFNAQRLGQLLDHRDGRVARAPLNVAHVSAMDASPVGIILLAPSFGLPEQAHVAGKALADMHVRDQNAVSTIVLQTISHIRR